MNHVAFRRVSKETKEIILKMLIKDPENRITPEEVLNHPFFVRKWHFGAPKKNIYNKQVEVNMVYR